MPHGIGSKLALMHQTRGSHSQGCAAADDDVAMCKHVYTMIHPYICGCMWWFDLFEILVSSAAVQVWKVMPAGSVCTICIQSRSHTVHKSSIQVLCV